MAALDSFKQMRDELAAGTKQQEVLLSFKGKGLKLNSSDDADTKEVVKQISMATTITALELTGNTVGSEAAAAIGECLTKRTELKRALWSDMFTGRMKTEIPPALRSLTGALITAKANLTELDLSDNAFGAQGVEGFQVFLRSPAAYQLKVLKLNNNGLGIAGGQLLAKCLIECHQASSAVGTPLSLTTFISGRNRLETPGATALAGAFAIIGTLERVEMIQNGIYHQGITALCTAFAKNKSLQIIDLSDNTFNQEGADSMAAVLPGLTQLESLSIGDCLLKTKGAEAVLKALEKHQRLRVLNLSGNEIGKDIVPSLTAAIRNKTDLERVDLSSNQLGSATAEIELLAGSIDEGSEEENEEENGEESDREASGEEEEEEEEEEEVEGENLGPAEPECNQIETDSPRSLLDMCCQQIAAHPNIIGNLVELDEWLITRVYKMQSHLYFPALVSQQLLEAFRQHYSVVGLDCRMLSLFENAKATPLFSLNLTGSRIGDRMFSRLLKGHAHEVEMLNVTDCGELSCVKIPNLLMPKLLAMNLGDRADLFADWNLYRDGDWLDFEYAGEQEKSPPSASSGSRKVESYDEFLCQMCDKEECGGSSEPTRVEIAAPPKRRIQLVDISDHRVVPKLFLTHLCPNLIALTLHGSTWSPGFGDFLAYFLAPLSCLEYLDLSYWQQLEDLRFLRPKLSQTVTSLTLYNVPDLYRAMDTLCDMKALTHLDVSQSQLETGTYPQPVTQLHRLVTNLTRLKSLDISSTNLPSVPGSDDLPIKEGNSLIRSDIVGLRGLSAPLQFLGLFNCDIASHYAQLPAEQVTGDFNEAQVLLSLERYGNRAEMMQRALNEAYQVYRNGGATQHVRALRVVAGIMERHPSVTDIQIWSSAALYDILRCVPVIKLSLQRRLVETFLSSMETHSEEHHLVHNCCLSLCQFEIPADILFNCRRAVSILLRVLRDHGHDPTTQRIVVFLLNSMACHVEGDQKVVVGDLGAVEQICELIRQRLARNVCDEVMEVSWGFLRNITDETRANCERFFSARGIELFIECYKTFTDRDELIRNMMGLKGNVTKVEWMMPCRFVHSNDYRVFWYEGCWRMSPPI